MKNDKYLGSCNLKDGKKLHNPPKLTKTKQNKTHTHIHTYTHTHIHTQNKTKQTKNTSKQSDTANLINRGAKIALKKISRVSHSG